MKKTVTFKLTRGDGWWTVTSSIRGLITQGRTITSALRNAADAARCVNRAAVEAARKGTR